MLGGPPNKNLACAPAFVPAGLSFTHTPWRSKTLNRNLPAFLISFVDFCSVLYIILADYFRVSISFVYIFPKTTLTGSGMEIILVYNQRVLLVNVTREEFFLENKELGPIFARESDSLKIRSFVSSYVF